MNPYSPDKPYAYGSGNSYGPGKCVVCKQEKDDTYWAPHRKEYICASCMRMYNPPYMTLIKFKQANYNKLWNLEVGLYEDFEKAEEIELCGWIIRSRQETIYKHMPKVFAIVYHMEFFGDVACGRCVDYPYFESTDNCLSAACKKAAKPFKPKEQIEYPLERSRYATWLKLI